MRKRDDLAFPIAEYERRLSELRERIAARGLDAALVTAPENICYLSGFDSPGHYWFQALVVPLEAEPFCYSRRLEQSGVEALTWVEHNLGYHDSDDPMQGLAAELERFNLSDKRLGYEKDCWFFTAAQQERLFAACPEVNFIDSSMLVEEGRLVKSDVEIAMMRQAARSAEAGMQAGIDAVCAGATENDVAAEVHYAMIKAGCDWPSIAPFIAAGERGAIGHATWSGRPIYGGDSVFIEIGGCRHRYHVAMMRTCFVGEPDDEVKHASQVVLDAFDCAMSVIKPGVPACEVDRVAREFIANSGFADNQASRTAYSIGIAVPPDWGEGQILSMKPGETRPLEANMTFHLLPWIQIPGKGGVGCTETIRVTETGAERITEFPRQLFTV